MSVSTTMDDELKPLSNSICSAFRYVLSLVTKPQLQLQVPIVVDPAVFVDRFGRILAVSLPSLLSSERQVQCFTLIIVDGCSCLSPLRHRYSVQRSTSNRTYVLGLYRLRTTNRPVSGPPLGRASMTAPITYVAGSGF